MAAAWPDVEMGSERCHASLSESSQSHVVCKNPRTPRSPVTLERPTGDTAVHRCESPYSSELSHHRSQGRMHGPEHSLKPFDSGEHELLPQIFALVQAIQGKHSLTQRILAEQLDSSSMPHSTPATSPGPTPRGSTSRVSMSTRLSGLIGWAPPPRETQSSTKAPSSIEAIVRTNFRKKVWRLLEDRSSSRLAYCYSLLVSFLIALGVFNYWSEFFGIAAFIPGLALMVQVFFGAEWFLRLAVCPNRMMFVVEIYNWVDLMTTLVTLPVIFATVGRMRFQYTQYLKVFCPVMMLLKLLRRFRSFHLLLTAFKDAFEALPLLMYIVFVIGSFFTALIYIVEPRSNIPNLGKAGWLVIVTMSTVGYGDVSATTKGGYCASATLIIISSLYMALPIGIIGSSFSSVWADRQRLMSLQHIRDYIKWAGMSMDEVKLVLNSMDENGDHQLSFDEFKELLPLLEVHLSETIALSVFQTLDKDEKGIIDFSTFLAAVFPGSIFGSKMTFRKRRKVGSMRNSQMDRKKTAV